MPVKIKRFISHPISRPVLSPVTIIENASDNLNIHRIIIISDGVFSLSAIHQIDPCATVETR
jgi:hypothetical protein